MRGCLRWRERSVERYHEAVTVMEYVVEYGVRLIHRLDG